MDPAAAEEQAARKAKLIENVRKMVARVQAGEDVRRGRKTRKVVRLSREECEKVMAIAPWPPVIPAHMYEHRYAGQDPEFQEKMRARKAEAVEHLKVVHAEWARVREQYAAHGYAEMAVEVDDHGVESLVRWEE